MRLGFSRTRIGQNVEANLGSPLAPFIQTRTSMGAIDVGGLNRFGPQSSANLRLVQNVFSLQQDLVSTRGRHLLKAGSLFEHYQDNMVNPTFSLGIYNFPSLTAFLQNRPQTFVGLTPEAQFDRYWRFWLFGFYAQDEIQATSRLTLTGGLRYEFTTLPKEKYGRDVALINLTDTVADDREAVRESDLRQSVAPRRCGLGRLRQRAHRRARRLRAVLQHEQSTEPDRHRHEPAVHAAACDRRTRRSRTRRSIDRRSTRSVPSSSISRTRACTCGT